MMKKNISIYLLEILRNSKLTFSEECINLLSYENIIVHYKTVIVESKAFEIYNDRYKLLNLKKDNSVKGLEYLILKLDRNSNDDISVIKIYTSDCIYIIFIRDKENQIVGILRSTNNNIHLVRELKKKYRERGIDCLNYYEFNTGR